MLQGQLSALLKETARNFRDFVPVLVVVAVFQWGVVGEPMPDLEQRLIGILLTLAGLTFFVRGLDMSLFPLGEGLAQGLAVRGSVAILLAFGFALGFGTTVAEPALASVADQAAAAAAGAGSLSSDPGDVKHFSLVLRYGCAAAVGAAVALGVLRIVKGWPTTAIVLPGYGIAAVLAFVSDSSLSVIAFDAGAASTSAINIPLIMVLGTGLATLIRGRSPLTDGFGLVAMASLMPVLVILLASLRFG
ncbi:MAG: DUF1538 domain-containing protein [Gammaproteobacteria bacterium]|nr:DUF1538 domain-containing protein [Gammaproteobacteria bacterium]